MRTKLKSVQEEAKSDCEIMVNSKPAPKGWGRRGAGRGGDGGGGRLGREGTGAESESKCVLFSLHTLYISSCYKQLKPHQTM